MKEEAGIEGKVPPFIDGDAREIYTTRFQSLSMKKK